MSVLRQVDQNHFWGSEKKEDSIILKVRVQILNQAICISQIANTLEKIIHPNISLTWFF